MHPVVAANSPTPCCAECRQRIWGSFTMTHSFLRNSSCWFEHMQLDMETGVLYVLFVCRVQAMANETMEFMGSAVLTAGCYPIMIAAVILEVDLAVAACRSCLWQISNSNQLNSRYSSSITCLSLLLSDTCSCCLTTAHFR